MTVFAKPTTLGVYKSSEYFSEHSQMAQSANTCSKLTIETLQQDMTNVQSQQKRHQDDANGVILVSLLSLNIFNK